MKAIELLSMLTKGIIPVENCGTANFVTSDLYELQAFFGKNYSWRGHMLYGDLFYVRRHLSSDAPFDDYDLLGCSLDDDDDVIYVFFIND